MSQPFPVAAFVEEVVRPEIAANVAATIDRLTPDPSLDAYRTKLKSLAKDTPYWDVACALSCLARRVRPARYLEIGVRRGKSMAQVVVNHPDCHIVGVDMWISRMAASRTRGRRSSATR